MIDAAVYGDTWERLACPDLDCRQKLSSEDIRAFATKDSFQWRVPYHVTPAIVDGEADL